MSFCSFGKVSVNSAAWFTLDHARQPVGGGGTPPATAPATATKLETRGFQPSKKTKENTNLFTLTLNASV